MPFANEHWDLKVVLATPCSGVLRHAPDLSLGGFLDTYPFIADWTAGTPIGTLEDTSSATVVPLRLLMLTGRRWLEPAAVDRGPLLAGWHDRGRGWWYPGGGGRFGHILGIGICEMLSIVPAGIGLPSWSCSTSCRDRSTSAMCRTTSWCRRARPEWPAPAHGRRSRRAGRGPDDLVPRRTSRRRGPARRRLPMTGCSSLTYSRPCFAARSWRTPPSSRTRECRRLGRPAS